jgi:hypothetical protein
MEFNSYHSRRAHEELQRSRDATDDAIADAHRQLGMMHVSKLMASGDDEHRLEAQQLLALLEENAISQEEHPSNQTPRPKLGLRFG